MGFWRRERNGGPPGLEDLAPQTPLDSLLRDFLCRILERDRTITLNLDTPREPGMVRWEGAMTPTGSRQITLWFEPAQAVSDPDSRIESA